MRQGLYLVYKEGELGVQGVVRSAVFCLFMFCASPCIDKLVALIRLAFACFQRLALLNTSVCLYV